MDGKWHDSAISRLMKLFYILFLGLLSIAELLFTFIYYALTLKFDFIPMAGILIYLACVVIVTLNYRLEVYETEKRKLLDGLLQ